MLLPESRAGKFPNRDGRIMITSPLPSPPGTAIAEPQKTEPARAEARSGEEEIVVKTYPLKYVSWREVANAARLYVVEAAGSDSTLTVLIRKKNIADFEAVLKKLDVERKNIMFRIYTIIAAKDGAADIIKKPEDPGH